MHIKIEFLHKISKSENPIYILKNNVILFNFGHAFDIFSYIDF